MINVPTWKMEGWIVLLVKITCLPYLRTFDFGKRQRFALREQLLLWTRLGCKCFPHVPRSENLKTTVRWCSPALPLPKHGTEFRKCEILPLRCHFCAARGNCEERSGFWAKSLVGRSFFGSQTCHSEKQTFTRCLRKSKMAASGCARGRVPSTHEWPRTSKGSGDLASNWKKTTFGSTHAKLLSSSLAAVC